MISNVQRSPDTGESHHCTPRYSPCLPPALDFDCRGGSGNGPKYTGPVRVTGSDPYELATIMTEMHVNGRDQDATPLCALDIN